MYITLRISKIKIFQIYISMKIILRLSILFIFTSFTLFAIILLYLKNDFIFIMSKNIILATIYKLVF